MIQLRTAVELSEWFWPEFQEIDGAVYLRREVPKGGIDRVDLKTRTEAESFYNHVHVLDLFRHRIPSHEDPEYGFTVLDTTHPDFTRAMELGYRLAEMWLAKLAQDFPDRRFRVYWTRLDSPIVRFHEVRADEPAWFTDEQAAKDVAAGDMRIYRTPSLPPTSA